MRTLVAKTVGRAILHLTRTLKIGGGSAAPGLFSLKIDPELVGKLSSKIPRNIVITGTNGKTTTARMIAHFATEAGLKVIRNSTGSNLERGIASALISNYTLYPKPYTLDLGIWELDEAAFNKVAPKLRPDIIIFLNVSRDQLDRYGEIDKVVNDWCNTLSNMNPDTLVIINQDDAGLTKLADHFKGKVQWFGKRDIKNIKTNGLSGSSFDMTINDKRLTINLPIPGLYHIYDALAAISVAYHLGLPINQLSNQLINYKPAFGRFEQFELKPRGLRHKLKGFIFLIKNPAGATAVFETLAPEIKKDDRILIALNDKLADGTDVSWIWDALFEHLAFNIGHWTKKKMSNLKSQMSIVCSGSRAYDLAVRLKYAGFDPNSSIHVQPSLEKALKEATGTQKGRLFILPTYTAMLELQSILTKSGIKKHYWEEEGI